MSGIQIGVSACLLGEQVRYVASVIKARRHPTARADAGSLRAHSEPYGAAPRDVHGQHRDRAPAPTPKPHD
jgi:hypothetical protein